MDIDYESPEQQQQWAKEKAARIEREAEEVRKGRRVFSRYVFPDGVTINGNLYHYKEHDTIICQTLDHLQNRCERYSGVTKRFDLACSVSRVKVEYTNPDEYGNEHPIYVRYPVVRHPVTKERVVVEYVTSGRGSDEEYQAFDLLWWESHSLCTKRWNPQP